jgi:hypothetical protein
MRRVRAKGVNEPCLFSVDVIPPVLDQGSYYWTEAYEKSGGGTCYYQGQRGILGQSQQLESSEAIRRAGKGTLISLLTLHFYLIPYKTPQLSGSLEGLSRLRNNGPFLEDMVQPCYESSRNKA